MWLQILSGNSKKPLIFGNEVEKHIGEYRVIPKQTVDKTTAEREIFT